MFRRADLEGVDSGWFATLPPIFGKAKELKFYYTFVISTLWHCYYCCVTVFNKVKPQIARFWAGAVCNPKQGGEYM